MSIQIKDMSFSYKKSAIFKHVNLELESGIIYGLVAPNGSGKTTLLDLIAGNLKCNEGTITTSTTKISYAQDVDVLYEDLSVKDHLDFILGVYNISQEDPFYLNYLHKLEIDTYLNKKVKACSLGMKKKLLLFLAILPKPDILLLDEPLNGLDIDSVITIREILEDITKDSKMTILISTHNIPELEKLSTRVILIKDQNLILKSNINNIEMEYIHEYKRTL